MLVLGVTTIYEGRFVCLLQGNLSNHGTSCGALGAIGKLSVSRVATSQSVRYPVHTWANSTDYACKRADMLIGGVIFSLILEAVH